MPKQIIISEQHHIAAVFWEDQIQELVVATGNQQVSDIYLGVVENVIPGIDAAFVNIGDAERNGFIHVTDLGPLRLKKAAAAITELLVPQQKVLVQVMKEPTGNKGPRLTGNVSLPGRYLVLMPYGRGVNLSRRIKDDNERSRLRALAILIKPSGMGLLVRTEADGKAEETIIEDLENLQRQWETIQEEAQANRAPALLNRDDDFIQRVLRDMYSADVNRIVVDSPHSVKRVKQQLMNWSAGKPPERVLIDYHRERQSILEYFRVNAAIREALKPRVELPSGGYIIIEPTEALTVVDVNSGSFTRSATSRETVLWTNSEAATEIARQLRLRNIGGVIIVDFIDMDSRRDQLKLLEHFNKALRSDKARPQIAQLSELGLVELTRKRQGQNIYELFGKTCANCGGLGHLAHLPGESELQILELPTPASLMAKSSETISAETDLSFDLPVDFGSDEVDLNLVNHPSYQEQGGLGSVRRRRRLNLKEDETEKPTPVNGKVIESPNEFTLPELKERITPRTSRREVQDLEVVEVEMNELERDVYALMGISPLVLLEREFPSQKNILLQIKAPGEKSPDSSKSSLTNVENSSIEELVESNSPEIITPQITESTISQPESNLKTGIILNQNKLEEQTYDDSEDILETEVQDLQGDEENLTDIEDDLQDIEGGDDRPIIRRRRRRSSAGLNGE